MKIVHEVGLGLQKEKRN